MRALADYIDPEGCEKTIIFRVNDEHADLVVKVAAVGIYDLLQDFTDMKPEDYLNGFLSFVKENGNRIEALKILAKNPSRFNRDNLSG